MSDPKRRTDARSKRTREDPAYSMVDLPRRNGTTYAVTSDSSEYDEEEKRKDLIPSLWGGLAILLILLINLTLHHYLYNGLPTPLTVNDLVAGKDLFITERAKSDLIGLAEIGEKVVGSYENEVLAVEYLRNILQKIQAEATNNKTVQIDVARGSGAFFVELTYVYLNVGNVIARLSDGDNSNAALLVNCHYDSGPSSPGAGDNGMNCAIMLEVLRVLSQSQTTLTHDIIFLFNGAEETFLQASHAFVTTHRWAADVRAFLNYDSGGFGGREALFQSGPKNPWLNAYYASAVPHPHVIALFTDLFENELIPSDTDFRIFRDFGNLHGLDMVQYAGGHVYHTLYDDYHIIPDGSYQHTGDNMLALIKALSNAPELLESTVEGSSVCYDFLGLFVIRYSTTIAIILNVLTALLALASPFWPTPGCSIKDQAKSLGISLIFQILGILLGFGLSVFVGMLLDWTDNAMSWYSNPGLLIGLFAVPTMIPMLGVNWALTAQPVERVIPSSLGTGQRVQLNTQAVGILWAIILIALTNYGLKSAYAIAIIVGFVTSANIITSIFKLQRLARVWLAIFIGVGLFIPTLYLLWFGSIITSFLPILGRQGSIIPDLYISLMMALVTSLIGSFWAPLIAVVRRPQVLVLGFSLAAVITVLAATLTTYGFPYTVDLTSPKPQRLSLIHEGRPVYGGFRIEYEDRNGARTVKNYISEYSNATRYSGEMSSWIPSKVPTLQSNQPVALLGVWNDTTTESRRLYLNLTGPDHMTLEFALRDGVTLSNWSFHGYDPKSPIGNGNRYYTVYLIYGIKPETAVNIWLDLVVSAGVNEVIDVLLDAEYLHDTTSANLPYASILKQLPLWVAPLHYSATLRNYTF